MLDTRIRAMKQVLPRLVLPLLLTAAAIGAWVASDGLGDLSVEPASGAVAETLQTPLVSVARLPDVARSSQRTALQQSALDSLPEPATSLACAAVYLDGELLWSSNADAALVPGFAQLAVTGHAALDTLGANHRFETRALVAAEPDEQGTVNSALYIEGGGDPVLMSFLYRFSFTPVLSTWTPIEELADAVADAGVSQIDGSVIGVDTRFDQVRFVPGLSEQVLASGVVGLTSALQLDDGRPTTAEFDPSDALADPASSAASTIDDLLEERGITVTGVPRSIGPDEDVPELIPLATVESPPLNEIIFQMLAVNDASAAEMLVKELGVQLRGIGSTQAGGEAIVRTAEALGVDLTVAPRGGSGLDPVSFSSCREVGGFVAAIEGGSPTLAELPAYDLPGVYNGELSAVDLDTPFGLVGGRIAETASFVGRTTDDGPSLTVVSIINRPGGAGVADTNYHRALLGQVDALRTAFSSAPPEPQ